MHIHAITDHTEWTIRPAGASDAEQLRRLAQLDSQPALAGPALIAEVGREPWAAVELRSGRVVADPFRPSSHMAEATLARAVSVRRAA